jgi:hypothetical protein
LESCSLAARQYGLMNVLRRISEFETNKIFVGRDEIAFNYMKGEEMCKHHVALNPQDLADFSVQACIQDIAL